MISLHLNGVLEKILVCVQFLSKLAKLMLPNVHDLSCNYLDYWVTFSLFPFLCPNSAQLALMNKISFKLKYYSI